MAVWAGERRTGSAIDTGGRGRAEGMRERYSEIVCGCTDGRRENSGVPETTPGPGLRCLQTGGHQGARRARSGGCRHSGLDLEPVGTSPAPRNSSQDCRENRSSRAERRPKIDGCELALKCPVGGSSLGVLIAELVISPQIAPVEHHQGDRGVAGEKLGTSLNATDKLEFEWIARQRGANKTRLTVGVRQICSREGLRDSDILYRIASGAQLQPRP